MGKFIVAIHSVIDVITNSSTEIFCAVKGKSKEAIYSVLEKITKDLGYTCMEFSVSEHEIWDGNDYVIKKGEYQIDYEQCNEPCKAIMEKIKEVLEVIEEN